MDFLRSLFGLGGDEAAPPIAPPLPGMAPERSFGDKLTGGFDNPLTQFGLAMMASASKPGASLLGSVGEGGIGMMNMRAKNEEREAIRDYRKAQTAGTKAKMDAAIAERDRWDSLFGKGASTVSPQTVDSATGQPMPVTPAPVSPLLAAIPPEQREMIYAMGPTAGRELLGKIYAETNKPNTDLARINADEQAGRITPEQAADARMAIQRKATPDWQNPEYQAWKLKEQAASRPVTNVTVEAEKAGEKERAISHSKRIDAAVGLADDGRRNLGYLQAMRQAMETAQQGAGAESITKLKGIAKAAGIDLAALGIPDNVGATELFQAMSNRLALGVREPGTGSTSDRDLSVFQTVVPGLSKSKEGNKYLADLYERQIRKDMDFSREARRIDADPKLSIAERSRRIDDLRDRYTQPDRDVIKDADMEMIRRLSGGGSDPGGNQGGQGGRNNRLDTPGFVPAQSMEDLKGRGRPPGPNAASETPPAGAPPEAKKAPDGYWYVPDRTRPGKFLKVG